MEEVPTAQPNTEEVSTALPNTELQNLLDAIC